jgi:hypothetical protein
MGIRNLERLEAVDLRTHWVDEARDFTPWLAQQENLALLGDTIGLELELEGMEVRVGAFKADILAKEAGTGEYVLIENQLERTNHDHLGKVITYASGLGATAVVWIAGRVTEEHRRAVDWLNEVTTDAVGFFALEVELWRIGESLPAPKFNLVSQPNQWAKAVSGGTSGQEPSGAKLLQLEFWKAFVESAEARRFSLNLRKPRPQHWYTLAIGRAGFTLSLTASTSRNRVGCELYMRDSDPALSLLGLEKAAIETELGPLEWQQLPEKRAGRIVQYREADIEDRASWAQYFDWLAERAESFYRVFSPRVRALDLGESEDDDRADRDDDTIAM